MKFMDTFKKVFFPIDEPSHHFSLPSSNETGTNNTNPQIEEIDDVKEIYPSIDVNIEYIRVKYNLLINSDIVLREFTLNVRN